MAFGLLGPDARLEPASLGRVGEIHRVTVEADAVGDLDARIERERGAVDATRESNG